MDKQAKNLERVRKLYWGLFIMVLCMVSLTALGFFHGAVAGANISVKTFKEHNQPVFTTIDFDVKDGRELSDYGTPTGTSPDGGVAVYSRVNSYNLLMVGKEASEIYTPKVIGAEVLILGGFGCQIAVFVLLFMILGAIRRGLKNGTVFSRAIIRYMKLLAIMVIASTIASDVALYLMHLNSIDLLTQYCPDSGLTLDAGVPVSSVSELFIGVVIMFLAEIFNIGYNMTEEQKLTI